MNRNIREAKPVDITDIMQVMEAAKKIMRSSGNMHQWGDGYPSEAVIFNDMEKHGGFVIEDAGRIVGYFAFLPSPEPTYSKIYDGEWLDDTLPYHVIHRIASNPEAHGIFSTIMDFCFSHDSNIRIRIIGSCSTTSKSMALPIVVSSTLSMEMSDLLIRN